MVKYYTALNDSHMEFITSQPLFFTASAPWAGSHINVSPKGHPSRTFSILGPNTVAYLDATGSGCETISHIYENGRVTIMFCSFGPSPMILRLFCRGRVVEKWDPYYQQLRAKMATENGDEVDITGARAIIVLKVHKVQTSCGFAVPMVSRGKDSEGDDSAGEAVTHVDHGAREDMENGFVPRETLNNWARKKVERKELADYQKQNNHRSLDGLPGMMSARRSHDENIVVEDVKAWFRKVRLQGDAVVLGIGIGMLMMMVLGIVGVLSIRFTLIDRILELQKRQLGIRDDNFVNKGEL